MQTPEIKKTTEVSEFINKANTIVKYILEDALDLHTLNIAVYAIGSVITNVVIVPKPLKSLQIL